MFTVLPLVKPARRWLAQWGVASVSQGRLLPKLGPGRRVASRLRPAEQLRDNTGYCDSKAKTIYLNSVVCNYDDTFVPAFLIHEICHDQPGTDGHDSVLAAAMESVARRAAVSGDERLADTHPH